MSRCENALKYYYEQDEKGVAGDQFKAEIKHKWNLLIWLWIKDVVKNPKAMEAYKYYLECVKEGENKSQIKNNISNKWNQSVLSLVQRAIEIDADRISYATIESY